MAYVTAGPSAGPVVLLLHSEPTWSFLYRSMLPALVDAGFRVIAPGLVDFGRPDKLAEQSDHTFDRQRPWTGSRRAGLVLPPHMSDTGIPYGHTEMPHKWWEYRRTIETRPDIAAPNSFQNQPHAESGRFSPNRI
jgi:haloalkane dehalogenase